MTDSFVIRVCPRNEFIQLTRSSYGPVARLKHLHWLRTDWVSLPLKLQGNDQLITSLRAPRRCLSLSAQPQANKPGVRKLTSSRRFDYLIVKERNRMPGSSARATVNQVRTCTNERL